MRFLKTIMNDAMLFFKNLSNHSITLHHTVTLPDQSGLYCSTITKYDLKNDKRTISTSAVFCW